MELGGGNFLRMSICKPREGAASLKNLKSWQLSREKQIDEVKLI